MLIAVTGNIGSGKSKVAREIVHRLGALHFDTDSYCRQLLEKDQRGYRAVISKWGDRYLVDNGELDRSLLRHSVFNDNAIRKGMEAILHPMVQERIRELKQKNHINVQYMVIEVPLLFEVGWQHQFDKVIVVSAQIEQCRTRVMERDNVTAEDVDRILARQLPVSEKTKRADFVIENSGVWDKTIEKIEEVCGFLQNASGG